MKMIISCIGDSLTEGDYGIPGRTCIPNVHKENYPYFLEKLTNCEIRNYGYCGYKPSDILLLCNTGKINLQGSNIIIILLGTNGGLDGKINTTDNEAFYKLIEFCKKEAPQANLYICTPPHVTTNPKYSNCGYFDRVRKSVFFVRKLANELNLYLIDLAKSEYFTDLTEDIMQPNDGLHFGLKGYQTLAKVIYDSLLEFPHEK